MAAIDVVVSPINAVFVIVIFILPKTSHRHEHASLVNRLQFFEAVCAFLNRLRSSRSSGVNVLEIFKLSR
jgi:hypothetical protein